MVWLSTLLVLAATTFLPVNGIELDSSSPESIKSAASAIANGLVKHYNGNETGEVPGILGQPYFWWEAGAFFDVLVQYQNLTGDVQYNKIVSEALAFQKGSNNDYLPANQTATAGNDDQCTWALAALSAAEAQFPMFDTVSTSYIDLAEKVFDSQVRRWDVDSCEGGLRWQIFPFNAGYDFKNTFSNGNFFQLAARLAHSTGNTTFSEWATRAFDWTREIGLVDDNWNVYDGAQTVSECKSVNRLQFSSAAGTYITGAANMYNITNGDSKWKDALDGLLNRTLEVFFPGGIATEVACEPSNRCQVDMRAFKGLLAHQLVDTIRVAPYTSERIRPLLTSSAEAAAGACNESGDSCGLNWNNSVPTQDSGVGEQLSALSYVQALLLWEVSSTLQSGNATTTTGSESGSQANPTSSGTSSSSSTGTSEAASGSINIGFVVFSGIGALIMLAAL